MIMLRTYLKTWTKWDILLHGYIISQISFHQLHPTNIGHSYINRLQPVRYVHGGDRMHENILRAAAHKDNLHLSVLQSQPPARWAHGLLWWPRKTMDNVVYRWVKISCLYWLLEIKLTIINIVAWWRHMTEISQPSVTIISLKNIFLIFYWNLPGAYELIMLFVSCIIRTVHYLSSQGWKCDMIFGVTHML